MKSDRKQIWALMLMVISLIFLAGFLILFIRGSYNKEKENLQKEVGYLFVNSIRKIEGGIINKLIFTGDSALMNYKMRMPRLKLDSLKIKSVVSIAEHNVVGKEGRVQMEIRHREESHGINEMEGSVAMFVALSHDSTQINDSCRIPGTDFLKELQENFQKNMRSANLPIQYKIIKESENSDTMRRDLSTGSYTDISTGERYLVNIENYNSWIIRKISPEILFSAMLFICVILAFYLVFKALNTEKMLLNLKSDFIQNITHELKTPIATVSVALEAMRDFNVHENQNRRKEYLDISHNELRRLSLLVDKVLNISQVDRFQHSVQLVSLDVKEIIGEILNTLKLQFEKTNVEVNFNCVGDEFIIAGDRQHVDVLLYNLLDNAIKYNNSTQPRIDIQLLQKDGFITITVADNGIGIPAEHQKNVFQKFYRVPQGDIHNVKGHGLGLSFVAQVVKEMNGEIQLESEQTVGSTFIIKLPDQSKRIQSS